MTRDLLQITSLQNARVKNVVKLASRRQRDRQKLTVIEGWREALLALEKGIVPIEVYVCSPLQDIEHEQAWAEILGYLAPTAATLYKVSAEVFAKMAYREQAGGILLVVPYQHRQLSQIPLSDQPLLLVVDGVEKPGNLGAILRTADAAGIDGVILTNEQSKGTDIHSPNVIRASLGAAFTVPVVETTVQETATWLKERGILIVATSPAAELVYTDCSLGSAVAMIMGSEATGLGPVWLSQASQHVRIPMNGSVDSLNLSTACALLMYEAVRQRRSQSYV